MLRLKFSGGAGEVTGSRHYVETENSRILMDCGLFQGHRRDAIDKNRGYLFEPTTLQAVLLSHAHIDHSGSLPLLARSGFKGPIYATAATQSLCGIMLPDSGRLQEDDAAFFNKIHAADGHWIAPLYTEEDAAQVLTQFKPVDYDKPVAIQSDITATFLNAGHVLGSAMIQLDVATSKGKRRILFTGDLGRRKTLLMKSPEIPKDVDYLLIESTYGDRLHGKIANAEETLEEVLKRAVKEKGKVLIPSFALERTQEIVFILEKLRREGRLPPIPLYVDSPMAVNITEIFNQHLGDFHLDEEFKDYIAKKGDPFGFENVHYVRTPDESKRLNDIPGPMVIVSASGMLEGGRILHHLRNTIAKESTTILLVGYQAEGTLGRKLFEGAKKVKIFGLEHDVMARVQAMSFFSAHADQSDLLWFIEGLNPRPKKIFLVHGDPNDRNVLSELLKTKGISEVESPNYGEVIELT
jgi:metallo-beta-lactamase family protein